MNKFAVILLSLISAVFAVAAERSDTASLGDLVSALGKPERSMRLLALLDAWDAAPARGALIRKFLIREFAQEEELNPAVRRKLERLWGNHPADLLIAEFAYRSLSGIEEEKLFCSMQLDKTVHALDQAGVKSVGEARLTGRLIAAYLCELREKQEYESGNAFLHEIFSSAVNPLCRPYLLTAKADFYREICFFEYDSAPQLKSWRRLAGRPWFDAYGKTLAELRTIERGLEKETALELLGFYLQNHDRQAFAEYARFLKTFPADDQDFAQQLNLAALTFRDLEFYRQAVAIAPRLKSAITELVLYDDAAAETLLRQFPEQSARELRIIRLLEEKKYADAVRLFNQLPENPKPRDFLVRGMLSAAENQRDAALWHKLYALRSPAQKQDPSCCNGFGYVAAVLNIELDAAQKLLELAVRAVPDDPAYADSMAYLFYRKGDFAQAKKWIVRAMDRRVPGMPVATLLLHAAEITWQADHDRAAARKLLDRALFCAEDDEEFDMDEAKKLREILK